MRANFSNQACRVGYRDRNVITLHWSLQGSFQIVSSCDDEGRSCAIGRWLMMSSRLSNHSPLPWETVVKNLKRKRMSESEVIISRKNHAFHISNFNFKETTSWTSPSTTYVNEFWSWKWTRVRRWGTVSVFFKRNGRKWFPSCNLGTVQRSIYFNFLTLGKRMPHETLMMANAGFSLILVLDRFFEPAAASVFVWYNQTYFTRPLVGIRGRNNSKVADVAHKENKRSWWTTFKGECPFKDSIQLYLEFLGSLYTCPSYFPLNSAATMFSLNLTKGFSFLRYYCINSLANGISQLNWLDSGDVNTERRVRFFKTPSITKSISSSEW
jgi:hypothetical protein